jgi:hypothetical protein
MGMDMNCSLILATLGRDIELVSFLYSLEAQTYRDFKLIIIDQNKDKKIYFIVEKFVNCFPINHIKVDFSGIAKLNLKNRKNSPFWLVDRTILAKQSSALV